MNKPTLSRRDVLRLGSLAPLGLGLADWRRLGPSDRRENGRRSARSCILIWLDGGPSHIDTFDPKPGAPREVRGPFKAIPTSVAGMRFSEYLPQTAKLAQHLAVVRSMTSPLGEHSFGSHYLLTGFRPSPALVYPSLGSIVASSAKQDSVLPPYINVGNPPNTMAGAGYLPGRYQPFVLGGDPANKDFAVADLEPYPGVTAPRLTRRRRFLTALDRFRDQAEGMLLEEGASTDAELESAYELVTSPDARDAFDLASEPTPARQRYGGRTLGQSCLIARRLVERGVPFVTVTDTGWDTHNDVYARLKEGYTGGTVGKIPTLDLALSALLEDLVQRRLLDETLVLVMGEFGRTPKLNTAAGRDHWPRVFSVVAAGGGVPGGQVIGASDAVGESPTERPVTPNDFARTVLTLLGVDPDQELVTADGRPVPANQGGEVVRELLG